jgi:hypothetical protein
MNCDGVRGLLSAYLDGELSPGELLRVEQHLRRCHACADEVDSLRQTLALVAALDEVEIPATFHASLHDRLVALGPPMATGRRTRVIPEWQRNVRRWAVPAAAAAAALAIGLSSYPPARDLARGLEAQPGRMAAESQTVAVNNLTPGGEKPVQQPGLAEPGKPVDSTPTTQGTNPVPQSGAEPKSNPSIPPSPGNATPGGSGQVLPDGPRAAGVNTTGTAPVQALAPRNTYGVQISVESSGAESLTTALGAYGPRVTDGQVEVTVPASQRDAVVAAIHAAQGVKVASEQTSQVNLAGQIDSLQQQAGYYRQKITNLENRIPKQTGSAQDEAIAEQTVQQELLDATNASLQRLNDLVDKAVITVHLQVQGQ